VLTVIANIFRFSYNQSPKIPVLVLVDASRSINVGDNIAQIKGLIDKIKQEPFGKKFYSFSDSIGPLENYEKSSGNRTDIGEAVRFAKDKQPGAIILISDGQQNTKTDPTSLSQSLNAPIYTIGIGSEQKQDISIQSIRKPMRSFLGDSMDVTARIQSRGFENQQVKVSLEHKGRLIASNNINATGRDLLQEVTFKIVPETIGKVNYTIKIDNLPNEANYANNRKDFSIEVLKNRWQILYLTNSPSFNTRFIISTLENTNGTDTKSTNTFSVIPVVAFVGKELAILKDLPIDKAFQNADVVVIDDINESFLNSELIARIINLTDQGRGFLILEGENFNAGSILKNILPFEFTAKNTQKKDIFIELSETGAALPIFFNETGDYLLDNTPPLWAIATNQTIKPDALVWAVAKETKQPLIGFRQYKNSKIVMVTAFPLWRLGFSSVETQNQKQKFEQFLKNMIRFLAIKELEQFKLITDKPNYLSGEDIIFNLLATTPDGRTWSGLDIKVEIPAMKVSLPLYETNQGMYEGSAKALASGEYEADAIISKDGKSIGNAKATFSITQQSIEDITGLNSDLLNQLSNATGGKYYSPDQFINEAFIPKTVKYKKTINLAFHNNPYIYIIITALFGIALFLRKKRGFL
jgi:hypothetical protein